MPINTNAVGTKSDPVRRSWTEHESLLYALGVGAGQDPLLEIEFTTENTEGKPQRAVPTMGVPLSLGAGNFDNLGTFDPAMLVHGAQAIVLHRELPVSGEIETVTGVTGLYDKGSGAVIEWTAESFLVGESSPLFTIVTTGFLKGEGGWGGDRGPSGPRNVPPERAADHSVTFETRPEQALVYRLAAGDPNPLHSDPQFAKRAGFDRPILHGLCTYGFTGRALLHALCGGDPGKFASMDGRFSAPVTPGETLTIEIWRTEPGSAVFRTLSAGDRVVLDSGGFTYHP